MSSYGLIRAWLYELGAHLRDADDLAAVCLESIRPKLKELTELVDAEDERVKPLAEAEFSEAVNKDAQRFEADREADRIALRAMKGNQ